MLLPIFSLKDIKEVGSSEYRKDHIFIFTHAFEPDVTA